MTETIKVMPYFMVYASDFKTLKDKLTEKEIIEILNAISDLCLYAETDFEPKSKFQKIWFEKIKDDFLKNLAKYKTCVENGRKGGRPPKNPTQNPIKTQEKPIGYLWDKAKQNPDETNKIKENKIKENKKEEDIIEQNNKPSKKEISDYCKIQGISNVNIDDFYSYYEAANWWDDLRNRPINWKQKLVTWKMKEKSNNTSQTSNKEAEQERIKQEILIARRKDNPDVKDIDIVFDDKLNVLAVYEVR